MVESEVTNIIIKVAKRLAPKFTFGFYDIEDIESEAFLIGMDGLTRYDPSKPLENFMSIHISNRLKSFKRDKYCRIDYKCPHCDGEEECIACEKREIRISTKKNLMEPLDISSINDENEMNTRAEASQIHLRIELHEISLLIDKFLEVELRLDYLKMLDGIYIPRPRKLRIEARILEILEENSYGE